MSERVRVSLRWKILGFVLVPVVLLIVVLTAAISSLVLSDNAREVDDHLAREARELSLLSQRAIDPKTGLAISDPKVLLELYITRTIPDPNETMFVLSDSLVFARTTDSPPVRLDLDEEFLNLVNQTQQVKFGDWDTEVGNARYVVVPVSSAERSGALVAIIFSDQDSAPMRDLLFRFVLIAVFALIGMLAIGYLVAGRIFRPIQSLTDFAKEVGEDQLQTRLPLTGSGDELDQLASEFNRMLQRLEEAFRSQKEFVDIAGHELRTPLTIVRGHLDLMQQNPAETESSMPIIRDELERMSRLVQDLQTLTKASSPDFVQLAEVDLVALAADLKSKIMTLTKRKISVDADKGEWNLDAQRISQAVLQLVENAIKYTPARSKIGVSIQLGEESLSISVSDNGPGVPAELRGQIWEPFVRGKGQQNIEGSGIGLSLVLAVARAHGGVAKVEDNPGGGAKFVIEIPRG